MHMAGYMTSTGRLILLYDFLLGEEGQTAHFLPSANSWPELSTYWMARGANPI